MAFDFKELINEIQDQYLEDDKNRPWIVGFSGGKDSTLLLQLTWLAVQEISEANRVRQIYVVCNNTLVENPKVLEYVDKVLGKIQEEAHKQSMPVFVKQTTPALEDSFWVNLIGKGYPAPNNVFRWCTERLKINPTTKFILEKISDSGEVIILLGTRSDESANRAKNIKKREVKGSRLRNHVLPNAYVYAAIKDVKTEDLWQYLAQVPSPWKSSNKELISLYKNANSGDCPLVIDKTTPSCGNSRFGCWVCTVVKRDKSMEALVENGEEWMEPLMELRDELAISRDDENVREKKRRDGTEKEGMLGPYKPEFRARFLKKLLIAQKEIQIEQPEINLINYQELVAIQTLWHRDNIFSYHVSEIFSDVFGSKFDIKEKDVRNFEEKKLLKEACENNEEDVRIIDELLSLQKSKTILMNNRGLQNDLENHLDKVINDKNLKG